MVKSYLTHHGRNRFSKGNSPQRRAEYYGMLKKCLLDERMFQIIEADSCMHETIYFCCF